jgi:Ca2+-transporting ATPase
MEDADEVRERDVGVIAKVMSGVRQVLGKRGYEEIAKDDEDRRISAERRGRETPSAIFAHKTVAVSPETRSI